MYIPEDYKNENLEDVRTFIQNNSFGILVNQTEGKLCATHIPLELDKNEDGKDVLSGHISKENPQWKGFGPSDRVLAHTVIFLPRGMILKAFPLGITLPFTFMEP